MTAADPFNLHRFLEAQETTYERALVEIRGGRKQSHWMWFIFPQFEGLGTSAMARRYAIRSLEEAEAYLRHPVLGPRLFECAEAALAIPGRSASDVFGYPDDLKLRSSTTLFARVSPAGSVFERLLEKYFAGEHDERTTGLLGPGGGSSVLIRLEQPDDRADVRAVNDRAFGTATESRLVDALRDLPDALSIVATIEGRVVGHILFTPVTIEPSTAIRVAGLGPMAVRPDRQRTGIGTGLVRTGLDECRRRGYRAVVVVGHPEYYPRFGFVPAHTKGLTCEFPVPPDVFMVLELEPDALVRSHGRVRYHPGFGVE